MLTRDDLLDIGFEDIPHFTIGGNMLYDLGRHKQLSITDIGNCGEMLWLTEVNPHDNKDVTDVINLHNFDYDGYLSIDRLNEFISVLSHK